MFQLYNDIVILTYCENIYICVVLSGTKYGLKLTRGKFGLGAKMALIWSKMSTGLPIDISSSMKGQNYSSFCRLDIDIHRFFQSLGTFFTFTYMKNGKIRNDGMELKSKLLLSGIEQLTVYGIAAIVKDQGSLLSYTFGLTSTPVLATLLGYIAASKICLSLASFRFKSFYWSSHDFKGALFSLLSSLLFNGYLIVFELLFWILLCDLVGFGVAIAAGTQFVENFPERTYKSMLIPIMQEDKRAGEATRKGFYVHNDKRKASPDPEIKKIVQKAREISGVNVDPKSTLVERAKSRL
ncbi:hypothetical protein ACSBR1_013863 [Camellia fascicularis]